MIPTRHLHDGMTLMSAIPWVSRRVRGAAATDTVAATARKPQASIRRRVADLADRGRAADALRRIVAIVIAACMLAGPAALAAADAHPAQTLVKQVVAGVTDSLESQREALAEDPRKVFALVDRLVLPYFDFKRMSRRVIGKRWRKTTPAQRERFIAAFRTLLVRTYALVLAEYRGQTMQYLEPVARKRDDEIIIPVKVALSNTQSVVVAYAMQGSGSDWKVFDVAIDGVSLVTNYRSSFRSEVARNGIDGLSARLEAKNSKTK